MVGLDGAFYLRDPAALLKHPKVGVGGFLMVSMRLFQPPLYQPKVKPKAAVVTVPDVTVFCPRDRKDAHPYPISLEILNKMKKEPRGWTCLM